MTIVPAQTPPRASGRQVSAPACAGLPVDTFYERKHLAKALETCAGCPVRMVCLREELQLPIGHQFGVRGGLTATRRREILRAWRQAGYQVPASPVRQAIATVVELSARVTASATPATPAAVAA